MKPHIFCRVCRYGWTLPLLFMSSMAAAESYRIPAQPPASMEEIERVVTEDIPTAMKGAMCGGWNTEESVGEAPGLGGKISRVRGVPGRLGDPLRNLRSGMAWRVENGGLYDDGFLFPDDASGLATTCDKETRTVMRWVWEPLDRREPGRYVLHEIENPYFEDPPCNAHPGANGKQSPAQCQAYCDWLNTFTYEDCRVFTKLEGGEWACVETGRKYTCSEEWETEPVKEESRSSSSEFDQPGEPEWSSSSSEEFFQSSQPQGDFPFPNPPPFVGSSSSFSMPVIIGPSSRSSSSSFSLPVFTGSSSSASSTTSGGGRLPPIDLNPGPEFPPPIVLPPAVSSSSIDKNNPGAADPTIPPDPFIEEDSGLWDWFSNFFSFESKKHSLTAQIADDENFFFEEKDIPEGENEFVGNEEPETEVGDANDERNEEAGDKEERGPEGGEKRIEAEGGFVPNCVPCRGRECRCPGPDCFTLPAREERMSDPSPLPQRHEKVYPSFYRSYAAATERDPVNAANDDKDVLRSTFMDIACYGFYDEFDPKVTMTAGERNNAQPGYSARRCVIAFPHPRSQLLYTQSVIGQTAPKPPTETGEMPERNPSDVWYPLLGGMSFLRESSGMELGDAFLNLDDARMLAAPPIDHHRPVAQDLRLLGGDETVTNQTGAEQHVRHWLTALQQDMGKLLTPPEARMRIPASWLGGFAESAKLVSVNINVDAQTGTFDPRYTSVDIQLRAGEDLQGTLMKELEKLFAVREEIVPAVIPAGSPREFRDRALQWRNYIRQRDMLGLPYPSEVWLVIGELERYAEQIEKYRGLRAQLSETVTSLMGDRENDLSAIAQWMEQTANAYREFDEQRTRRIEMAGLVRDVQKEMATFDDDVNMQWCRQDGFTTPIYSLLHTWYPGSPNLRPPTSCVDAKDTLPLLCMPTEKDMFVDFSGLVTSMQELHIPVLHVVQVLPEIPFPPGEFDPPPENLTALPELPPLPTIDIASLGTARSSLGQLPDPIEFPQLAETAGMERQMEKARDILQGRNEAYDEFWKSLEPPDATFWETLGFGEDPQEKRLSCDGWNKTPCVHVEMDLLERLTRITAMPGVYMREHLLVHEPAPDDASDETTIGGMAPPIHRVLHEPDRGFTVRARQADADWNATLERIRRNARSITIEQDGSQVKDGGGEPFPYVGRPEELYKIFNIPPDIDLLP